MPTPDVIPDNFKQFIPSPGRLVYVVKDLRDEFREYERGHRMWPRSRSCSRPLAKPPTTYREAAERAEEDFYRWKVIRLEVIP